MRMVPSLPADARDVPSGLKASMRIRPACPMNVAAFCPEAGIPDFDQALDTRGSELFTIWAIGQTMRVIERRSDR